MVIIIGIPYANKKEPQIYIKKSFQDQLKGKMKKIKSKKNIIL